MLENKTAILTGGSGFLGKYFINGLSKNHINQPPKEMSTGRKTIGKKTEEKQKKFKKATKKQKIVQPYSIRTIKFNEGLLGHR